MSTTIRLYQPADARDIAELYSRYPDNPNPVPGGISAEHVEQELAGRRTAAFFVAVDNGSVVGTFGLFRTTGRRSAREGELIADMFFVAPAYRNGMLTGRLFTEAIEWMVKSRCLVLRLTVNPANAVAFKLYRRVGCVSVGQTLPGEDGNVELYNYIPLILRGVLDDLPSDVLAALGGLSTFGSVSGSRLEDLHTDVVVAGGVRTVTHHLMVGAFRITAVVDVDRGAVRAAEVIDPDGSRRELRVTQPPYHLPRAVAARPYRFGTPRLSATVDATDGTVRVFGAGHVGPLLVSTWPGARPDHAAGWRESQPCDLEITPIEHGVRIVERAGADTVTGTVTLADGQLQQDFTATGPLGRIFQTVGLRQGRFVLRDAVTDAEEHHPIGLGLGVRDASELVAAARRVAPGSVLSWAGSTATIDITIADRAALVHSCLLERRPEPDPDGVARLRTEFGRPAPRRPHTPAALPGVPAHRIKMDAGAGGVTSWLSGATKVLRSPYPRKLAFAHNPQWSAGMWVTTERDRFSRDSGLGWGVPPATTWEEKEPLRLVAVDHEIDWDLAVPAEAGAPVVACVRADRAAEEVVLWLTPAVAPGGRVVVPGPGGDDHQLDPSLVWQIWTAWVALPLRDGRRLHVRPGFTAGDDAEIVVRSTPAGLLVGCVTQAGGPADWHLTVN